MHGLSRDLAAVLGEATQARLAALARLRRAWPGIVGPMLAMHTEPASIEFEHDERVCLWVAADHPAMAQQIRLLLDPIRRACFRKAGLKKLTHIRTRVVPGAGLAAPAPKPVPHPVPMSDKRRMARMLAAIPDRELKHRLFDAWLAQMRFADAPNPSVSG